MSWFRLDDQAAFHAKTVAAGNEAYGAWCRAGEWCSGHTQDGFIPLVVAHLIAPKRVWDRALKAGLLDATELPGYQIHDFNEYNDTKEEAEERRQKLHAVRSAAGRLGGLKSGSVRTGNKVQANEANPEAIASKQTTEQTGKQTKQNEAPSHPIPSHPKEGERGPSKSLLFEVTESYPGAVSAVTGEPYAIPHNQRLALNEVMAHFDGAPNAAAAWLRTTVAAFIEATADDRLAQGDRGPVRLLAWLNGGRKTGNPRKTAKPEPPPSPAYQPFRGHGS